MDRFNTARAWGPDPAGGAPRPSWFVDEDTPADRRPERPAWRDPRYDVMPYGTIAEAERVADEYMGTVDERAAVNVNTHPEYRRWLERTKAAAEYVEAQNAAIAASYDVAYDMEGRAFGVPAALPPDAVLRRYEEYDAGTGAVQGAPSHAKSFYYAVDARTGRPTSGAAGDGWNWNPTGKAAELDDFVRRTTQAWGVNPGLADPATWAVRAGVAPARDPREAAVDDALVAGTSMVVSRFAPPARAATRAAARARDAGHVAPDYAGPRPSAMRLQVGASTVSRPLGANRIQGVDAMNEASKVRAAEYAASQPAPVRPPTANSSPTTSSGRPTSGSPPSKQGARKVEYNEQPVESAFTARTALPCMVNSIRGAVYDLSHWRDLPTAEDGVLPTLQFVATRDGRAPYLGACLLLVLLALLLVGWGISSAVASARNRSTAVATQQILAALAANNPQMLATLATLK